LQQQRVFERVLGDFGEFALAADAALLKVITTISMNTKKRLGGKHHRTAKPH
jgi:hypothetical protein